MQGKQIDYIGNIINNVIKGIASGKSLMALQGSARAGKTYNLMIQLIISCINVQYANNLYRLNWEARCKENKWKDLPEDEWKKKEDDLRQHMERDRIHVDVIRLALPSLKRSVFQDFKDIMRDMGVWEDKRMNNTNMTYTFENGSEMQFFATADNEQKVRGSKRDILFVNEANEISEWEFSQLRMRTNDYAIVDFNPSFTEEHWLYKMLFEPRTYHFVSTFEHNPFLSEAIRDEIFSYRETNPALWQIFGLGQFAIVEGLVFPKENWDICEFTDIPIIGLTQRIGIDIGFSGKGDPTVAIRCWYGNVDGVKHMWLHQIVYEKGLNEKSLAYRLQMYKDLPKYIDSANPLYIQNLKDNGCTQVNGIVKYANSVIDGLNKMMGYHIHITRTSVDLIKEFQNYVWLKDREDNFTNVPIDKWNHGIDAVRYATMQDRSAIFHGFNNTKHFYKKGDLGFYH